MKRIICLSLVSLFAFSCATKTPYKEFKKENRKAADISIGMPAFLVHLFVPNEDVREFKEIVSGIRRYHVMVVSENIEQIDDTFDDLVENPDYEKLFYYREDGTKIDFYTYNKKNKIKEVVLKVKDGDDLVIVNMQGNIKLNALPSEVEDIIAGRD
ncbi:DUF4252 domain-containing protein [Flavobacteriaceae bacterium R38]|nr:DUF4252 domain-containing protein [Flavobacteriaceae bacterium R38]